MSAPPSDALEGLERHAYWVLLTPTAEIDNLHRAAHLLQALWREITPERWEVLLEAIVLQSNPSLLSELSRAVRRRALKRIGRERIAVDLRKAIDVARERQIVPRVTALLMIADHVKVAGEVDPVTVEWAVERDCDAAHCLVSWLTVHQSPHSRLFGIANELSLFCVSSDEPAVRLAWLVTLIDPTAGRWRHYALSWTDFFWASEERNDPKPVRGRLEEWKAAVAKIVDDGPARMILEQRGERATEALARAVEQEPDPFVRAVLMLWQTRSLGRSWHDEPSEQDQW